MMESDVTLLPSIIEAVEVVEAVEGTQWIPDWLQGDTFFSEYDFWRFAAISDDRLCFGCSIYDKMVFSGAELRFEFPYLEIVDANLIFAYIHPNCRCVLTRVINPLDFTQFDSLSWLLET